MIGVDLGLVFTVNHLKVVDRYRL